MTGTRTSPSTRRRRSQAHRGDRLRAIGASVLLIAAIAAVTYYAFTRTWPFTKPFTLHAIVANSVNLRAGAPVRIAGIDVGAVRSVGAVGRASEVTFTLSSQGQPVHRDATIRIRTRLFLEGAYYLELSPGTPDAPPLPDGGTIPESRTTSPVQGYEVLSTFDSATRAALRQLLGTVSQAFIEEPVRALKATVPQLPGVLEDTAWLSRSFRGTAPGDVGTLLRSTAQIAGTLAGSSSQAADLVSGLNRTAGALAASDGALSQSVIGLDETLAAAPPALRTLDRTLPAVSQLAVTAEPSLRSSPPILAGLTRTVSQLGAMVAPGARGRFLAALRTTFEQFPAVLTELGTTFGATGPVTDCLRTHVTPLLSSVVPDGRLSSGRPVWQDFVHFLPGVAAASGNFDGNGPYTRVLAALGTNILSLGPLGSLPIVGKLIGTAPPGGSALLGARPAWVGPLTSADFRPDVPCTTQRVPSLASPTAAPDLHPARAAAGPVLPLAGLRRLIARRATLAGAPGGR